MPEEMLAPMNAPIPQIDCKKFNIMPAFFSYNSTISMPNITSENPTHAPRKKKLAYETKMFGDKANNMKNKNSAKSISTYMYFLCKYLQAILVTRAPITMPIEKNVKINPVIATLDFSDWLISIKMGFAIVKLVAAIVKL